MGQTLGFPALIISSVNVAAVRIDTPIFSTWLMSRSIKSPCLFLSGALQA